MRRPLLVADFNLFMKRAIPVACLGILVACGGEPTSPPVTPPPPPPAQQEIPISGLAVAGMESFDTIISDFMRQFAIPAARWPLYAMAS